MALLRIVGGIPLEGEVMISGAKNSASVLLPACLLTSETCILDNVPEITDVDTLLGILTQLGARIEKQDDEVLVNSASIYEPVVPYDLARKLRASSLFLGPLLARFKEAKVAMPGGCDIGSRSLDLHIKGLRALGAEISVEHGYLVGKASKLQGCEIYLDFPSVGATENLMMAASLAEGTTVIQNAAKEPEIVDLANFLTAIGARVRGAGTDVLRIEGAEKLGGVRHTVIPDRIEAGTYLLAGLITGGRVTVCNVIPKHLEAVVAKLEETGAMFEVGEEEITCWCTGRLRSVQVKTMPYPGFPTDLQPQLTALLMLCEGTGIVNERVFEDRFGHIDELRRLGGDIKTDGQTAVVNGVTALLGAPVKAADLRMGAALILAALAAQGESLVDGVNHIDRGYGHLERKLAGIGANIKRIDASVRKFTLTG
ncbi:MAG: UDP-N-acetylglucosamine 1-carboxyvinyltransferase [Limnochordia bacterium]|jgi:UDP-N-acetylglucosamine 1-carboxyvinyltransferase|nr:UDP-N-acetylglucosamine 1-carboxyvinyltransferase [Limnochordia bacterium]MDD2630661.1 UDP-N-acetylglucosamine 1-carboxyvinyltransferase [Limnochordia bacterium]MDD4517763.1 UDP-N-acetylglucosamine 1-carboxyvinyltransferase [Limnochordia bacterium]